MERPSSLRASLDCKTFPPCIYKIHIVLTTCSSAHQLPFTPITPAIMPQTTPEAPIFLAHLTPSPRHSLTPNRHLCTLSFTLLPPPLFPQDLSLASLDERANQTAGALASGVRAVRTVRRIFARAGVEVQMTQESVRELYAYLVL